jgi:hypothetical protein
VRFTTPNQPLAAYDAESVVAETAREKSRPRRERSEPERDDRHCQHRPDGMRAVGGCRLGGAVSERSVAVETVAVEFEVRRRRRPAYRTPSVTLRRVVDTRTGRRFGFSLTAV